MLEVVATLIATVVLVRISRVPRAEPLPAPALDSLYGKLRRLVVGTIATVLGLWFLIQFASQTVGVLTLLAVSAVLAVALRPTVDRMSAERLPVVNRKLPRPASILLIYIVLIAAASGIGLLVVPQMVAELQSLVSNVPELIGYLDGLLRDLQRYPFVPDLSHLQTELVGQLAGGFSQLLNVVLFAVNLVTGALSFFLVLVLTFFMIIDADRIHDHLVSLLPPSRRDQAREVTARMGHKIEGWLKGILLLSAFVGAATATAMWALGMPYPLLLGLLAGLFELVPMVGAYLGAAPVVIVGLFQPTWKLIAVVVFFFALQQFENNVLAPTIVGRAVEMPPLLTILALLLGAAVMGIIGALLAVPVAAVLQVLWTDVVVPEIKQRYGEHV